MSASVPGTPAFVGRRAELARLRERFEALRDGVGSLVLVQGPAGMGKTSLIEQAVLGVDRVGRGYAEDHGAPPLWPWVRACGSAGQSDLAAWLDGDTVPVATSAEASAARLRWLGQAADRLLDQRTPLVLVLEDLHWADRATIDLLRAVTQGLPHSRVAVVATTRPGSSEHDTQVALLQRLPSTQVVDLGPLSAGEVADFLASTGDDPRRAREVLDGTGGLPLLLSAGTSAAGATYDVRRIALRLLAQTVPAHRPVLEAAAVLGEQIDEALLVVAVEEDGDAVRTALADGVAAGLLAGDAGRFAHALIRDAMVDQVARSAATEVHLRAARELARRTDAPAARIATHLAACGPEHAAEAASWFDRAAAAATGALAYDDAERFLTAAVDARVAAGGTPEEVARTRLARARAAYLGGRPLDALADCAHVARSMRDRESRLVSESALVVRGLGFPEANRQVASLARDALTFETDPVLRARLLAQLAAALADVSDMGPSAEVAEQAWSAARSTGDPEAVLEAAGAREAAIAGPHDDAERVVLADSAIGHARRLGRPVAEVLAQGWAMRAAYAIGDVSGVDRALEALASLADTTGLPLARWHLLRATAARDLVEGDLGAVRRLNHEAIGVAVEMGDPTAVGMSHAVDAELALIAGDVEGSRRFLAMGTFPDMPLVTLARGMAHLAAGEHDLARAAYERVRPTIWDPSMGPGYGGVIFRLAEFVEVFDDVEAATALLPPLEPWAEVPGINGVSTAFFGAPNASYVARLQRVLGRTQEAERHLRSSLEVCRSLRARPAAARLRCDLAELLLGRDSAAARREVRQLATHARDEAAALGLRGTRDRATSLVARVDASEVTPRLSRREQEIAALVLEALTNRDIAQRLVLSERTVESHVRSLLSKTGCASRTELIARRSELGFGD